MAKGRVKRSTLMKSKGGQRVLAREVAKRGSGRTTKIGATQSGPRKGVTRGPTGGKGLSIAAFKRKQALTKAKNVTKRAGESAAKTASKGFASAKQKAAALKNLALAWKANRKKK